MGRALMKFEGDYITLGSLGSLYLTGRVKTEGASMICCVTVNFDMLLFLMGGLLMGCLWCIL